MDNIPALCVSVVRASEDKLMRFTFIVSVLVYLCVRCLRFLEVSDGSTPFMPNGENTFLSLENVTPER